MLVRCLVVCGVFLLGLAAPAEAANQRIAVIEFVGQASDGELQELTDEARLGVLDVTKRKAYTVMTKESIATIARDLGVNLSKCTEAECEVDTGRQIGAHFVVTGKVSKIGTTFKFMMKIFDTETAALLTGDTIKAKDLPGLEAELRVFTRRQIADALGMGSAQAAPAASAGAPALAISSTSFGGGGDIKSAMDAKLKEKRCRNTAEQQGKILREQRLSSAVTQLEAEAKAAYDNLIPTLTVCVQLDFEERAECRDAVQGWLDKVRDAQVQLPAGEETVQTDCGPRLAVFDAADRRTSIDTKPAEAMLARLKTADPRHSAASRERGPWRPVGNAAQQAESGEISLMANPSELILGQDSGSTLTIQFSGGATGDGDLLVQASSGTVSNVTHLGGGKFAASYQPPKKFFPHLAMITVTDKRAPGLTYGSIAIPLVGKANFPVVGQPNGTVLVRIYDREFGPAATDAAGRAQVPIEVRPGFGGATLISIVDGRKTEESLDLKLPPGTRIALFPSGTEITKFDDALGRLPIRAFVALPSGAPDTDARVEFFTDAGVFSATTNEGHGVYLAYLTPNSWPIRNATITAKLDDLTSPQQTTMNLAQEYGNRDNSGGWE